MDDKSRVLIIGSTGYFGRRLVKASLSLGRPTYLLYRSENKSNLDKCQMLIEFKKQGAFLLQGSFDDHESLVSALKQVDVVISAIAGNRILEQLKLIEAIKEVPNMKRFLPTEFGMDVDRMGHAIPPGDEIFKEKSAIRRAIEKASIPHTYVSASCFAGIFLAGLAQLATYMPPEDHVHIYGDGSKKCIWVDEDDAATYTLLTISDPRTLNKTIYIRPPANTLSQMEVVNIWEKLIDKDLKKTFLSAEEWLPIMKNGMPIYEQIAVAHFYQIYFLGDLEFEPECPNNLDTTHLYPHHKYVTVEEYLKRFI